VLPMVAVLVAAGHPRVVVPAPNLLEARLVPAAEPIAVETLAEAVRLVAPRSRKARAAVAAASADRGGADFPGVARATAGPAGDGLGRLRACGAPNHAL